MCEFRANWVLLCMLGLVMYRFYLFLNHSLEISNANSCVVKIASIIWYVCVCVCINACVRVYLTNIIAHLERWLELKFYRLKLKYVFG